MSDGPSQILMVVLSTLGRQLPMLTVWAIVFVVALCNWSKYPRASLLTVLAVVIALGTNLLGAIVYPLLPRMFDTMSVSWVFFGISIFLSMLHGCVWLLLLGAIYSGRQPDGTRASV